MSTWVDPVRVLVTAGADENVGTGTDDTITDGQGLGGGFTPATSNGLVLQIGANNASYHRMTVNIGDMSANAIGIGGICVRTQDSARSSIGMVDGAIRVVSQQRAALGAMQNRLEHTVNSLTNQVENLTAAESRIRDADMAAEMLRYTKYTILQQVGTALLAQVNANSQWVLQLLR